MHLEEFREQGHRIVELLASTLAGVEEGRLFPDITPREVTALFDEPLPRQGTPLARVLTELEEKLLPNCTHVNHPGYMGLITPTPTPVGILGDFIASGLNQNVGAYTIGPGGTAIERRTVRWLTDLAGYGPEAGGNLTSGGTMANLIGMKLARDWASGDRAQHEGVTGRWRVYASEERHVSVDKAVDAVGLGRDGLCALPTDDAFRVRLDALEAAIASDKALGVRPMAIVAMAGSTNTGAVDALRELRAIADREKLWLHADAAYGGGMLLSHEHPGLLADLPLADSVTMDPHKWFYAPLDAGAILVRDEKRLTESFNLKPAYLTDEADEAGERYQYYVHGFEQSRRFRSLKVWMGFKRYGADEMGRWVDGNVAQARRLHELATARPEWESAALPVMSAACIGYRPAGVAGEALHQLHAQVARQVEAAGRFWISTTVLKGNPYFRVNPVNFRTRREHMEALFEHLVDLCRRATPVAR